MCIAPAIPIVRRNKIQFISKVEEREKERDDDEQGRRFFIAWVGLRGHKKPRETLEFIKRAKQLERTQRGCHDAANPEADAHLIAAC